MINKSLLSVVIFVCASSAMAVTVEKGTRKPNAEVSVPIAVVHAPKKSNLRVVPVLGLSSFDLKMEDMENGSTDLTPTMGVVTGAVMEIKTGPVTTGVGLVYQETGADYTDGYSDPLTGNSVTYEFEMTFSYLAIPVYAKYYFAEEGFSKFYVRGGAQIGYLTRAKREEKYEINDSWYHESGESKTDVYGQVRKIDVLVQPALGLEFALSENMNLVLDMSYNYGLTKLNYTDKGRIRNQGLNFLSGVSIGL